VTRPEALALLASADEVTYDDLADVFEAFGFRSEFEAPNVYVYYHAQFIDCGVFRAKEYLGGVLSPGQRGLVRYMLDCVALQEDRQQRRRRP